MFGIVAPECEWSMILSYVQFEALDEGTGLPIRNCAGSYNNLVPRGTKVSATDVTQKVFFEHLYWFQDRPYLSSESTVRVLPHPHCSIFNYFSIFVQFFSDVAPHFWSAHDSPVWQSPGTLPVSPP